MGPLSTPPRSLFAPLNLAAYVCWTAVLVGELSVPLVPTPLLPAITWVWIGMLGFLAAFVGCHVASRLERHALKLALIAAQAALALALCAITREGATPTLLVVVVAQLAPNVGSRALFVSAAVVNVVLYFEMKTFWHGSAPFVSTVLYAGFQLFAAMVTTYAHRAELANGELAQVNAHLVATRSLLAESARDAERLKLARELHDVAGHKLTALKLNLAALARDPRFADVEATALCARLADELLGEIRGVVRQMRDHEGMRLDAALRALAAPLPGLRVHFSIEQTAHVDSVEQAEAIVRAVQEGLTNAARHAHASQVWIDLVRDGERLVLDIRDDGRGAAQPKLGSGLAGMRERIEALGGGFALRPPAGGGFGVQLWLPVA